MDIIFIHIVVICPCRLFQLCFSCHILRMLKQIEIRETKMLLKRKRFNISFAPTQFIEELMKISKSVLQDWGGIRHSCVWRAIWLCHYCLCPYPMIDYSIRTTVLQGGLTSHFYRMGGEMQRAIKLPFEKSF